MLDLFLMPSVVLQFQSIKRFKSVIYGNIYNLKFIIQKCHYVESCKNVASSASAVLRSWHFSQSSAAQSHSNKILKFKSL